MSTSQSNTPMITWVNNEINGKSVKVYLTHPTWDQTITHWAWVPAAMAPNKFDAVESTTIKLGEVEIDYVDKTTGQTVALKNPRRQVSFYGEVCLVDGPEVQPTAWVDKRTAKVTPVSDDPFA